MACKSQYVLTIRLRMIRGSVDITQMLAAEGIFG